MISRFQLVALTPEEKSQWQAEQARPGRARLELNLRDAAIFSLFLATVTLLIVLATYLTGDSMAVMPAWMRWNVLDKIEILSWSF